MILKQTSAPGQEPISLAEAKNQLRVDSDDEDALIDGLITAAREFIEGATNRALITQTWRYSLDNWPAGDEIRVPKPPLQSVSNIKYLDDDGTVTTWSTSGYIVDTDSEPGRVVLAYGESWPSVTLYPAAPIQVTYVAGYGEDGHDVPQHLRQAILMLVAHWHEHREASGEIRLSDVPFALVSLIRLHRVWP